jgi:hypothetical protein
VSYAGRLAVLAGTALVFALAPLGLLLPVAGQALAG